MTPDAFEWDDAKAEGNRVKHGIPFDFGARVFFDPHRIEFEVSRATDGEERFKAVGLIDGRLFTVVFTWRGAACRIVSARRSNAKEGRTYGNRSQDAEGRSR